MREIQHLCPRRAPELQFYTSAAAMAMLIPAWIFFMVGSKAVTSLPHRCIRMPLSSAKLEQSDFTLQAMAG